jgi:hypothetical protein
VKAFAYINVSDPWIAWLAYRGEMVAAPQINPRAVSIWHAKYLIAMGRAAIKAERYRKETELEQFRSAQYPKSVSRLSGLYFFPTLEDAKRAENNWDGSFRQENLTEVDIVSLSRLSRYDSEWITHDLGSSTNSWFDSYFSGVARGANPIWELLVEGRALILETSLRERAYQVLVAEWPKSLPFLELSRVAVPLGSDLGVISPIVTVGMNKGRIDMMMNFADATNDAFLERFAEYTGPKNTKDLNASSALVVPDLRHLSTEFLF